MHVHVQVDRKNLPRHEFGSVAEYVAPRDSVEKAVHAAWQTVLHRGDEQFSIDENFFQVS